MKEYLNIQKRKKQTKAIRVSSTDIKLRSKDEGYEFFVSLPQFPPDADDFTRPVDRLAIIIPRVLTSKSDYCAVPDLVQIEFILTE